MRCGLDGLIACLSAWLSSRRGRGGGFGGVYLYARSRPWSRAARPLARIAYEPRLGSPDGVSAPNVADTPPRCARKAVVACGRMANSGTPPRVTAGQANQRSPHRCHAIASVLAGCRALENCTGRPAACARTPCVSTSSPKGSLVRSPSRWRISSRAFLGACATAASAWHAVEPSSSP
jgi:hypothetical protein